MKKLNLSTEDLTEPDIVYHSVATVYEWLITRLSVYMDEIRFVKTFCVIGGAKK